MQEPVKAPEELPRREAGGGRGKEEGGEPQKHVLQLIPTYLNPTANGKTTYSPLPVALSTDEVYILPTPATQSTPKTPTTKATSIALSVLQKFEKLVATVQAYATTSKTLAIAYIAWHSGWFGCRFGFRAPEPRHF